MLGELEGAPERFAGHAVFEAMIDHVEDAHHNVRLAYMTTSCRSTRTWASPSEPLDGQWSRVLRQAPQEPSVPAPTLGGHPKPGRSSDSTS